MKKIPKIKRVQNIKEVDDFYQKIITNVKNLINDKNYDQALNIINEELEQPYLPIEYFDYFHELKAEINLSLYDKKLEKKYWSKTQNELLEIILINPEYEYWDVFLAKSEDNENLDKHYEQINLIFENKQIPLNYKLYLFSTLIELNVDYNFNFFNNNTGILTPISPSKYQDSNYYKNYIKTINYIYDICEKDITKTNFSIQAIEYFRDYFFPVFEFKNYHEIAKSICKFIDFTILGNLDNFTENAYDEIVFNILKDFYC